MIENSKRMRFRMIVPKYPAFNVYSNAARKTTALGPICVATAVSKLNGWDVEVIDENNYRFPGPVDENGAPDHRALQELRPADVVGLYGGLSCTVPRLFEVASLYRDMGVKTVGGGQHLDFLPEEALKNGLDVVVHGEGEPTIAEVLTALRNETSMDGILGISFMNNGHAHTTDPRPLMETFEHLPLPDFGLLRFARLRIYPVTRIRGCGNRCEFCSVKGRARCATPERLVDQFAYLAETFRAHKFLIVDDQFAQDREETLRFCKLLAEYQKRMQIRFFIFAQIRLEAGRDHEMMTAMRACGIRVLAIGFESVIDEELRAMGKGQKAEEMLELTRNLRQFGFILHGMFIFGYPLRRKIANTLSVDDRVKLYRRFIRKAKLDTVQILHIVPLPGTALRARLERQGRVYPLSEIGWQYYDGNFQLVEPDPPATPLEMQWASERVLRRFYRFGSMFTLALRILLFPFLMLPLTSLSSRWKRWYRSWRRSILTFAGWTLMRRWRKRFRKDPFQEKLQLQEKRRRTRALEENPEPH